MVAEVRQGRHPARPERGTPHLRFTPAYPRITVCMAKVFRNVLSGGVIERVE